jgi:hypothetical protein
MIARSSTKTTPEASLPLDASVEAKGGAWITRRIDIARWWHEHHASFPV